MITRIVLHLDMDAFYASVEQLDHAELRGKPVIVGADPMDGRGRGVVTAASYEARAFGVRSAMPISQAWRLCPHGEYVYPRFSRYAEISHQVFDDLRTAVDTFEPASIDEAYADVTARCGGDFDAAAKLAMELKQRVRDSFGLSASVGVGPNKVVAKIATDLEKPDGLTVVTPERLRELLDPLPARVIPGVGPKTASRLAALGITTVGQLAAADAAAMQRDFGSWGPELVLLSKGIDERPVDPSWERRSVGSEQTFLDDVDPGSLTATLDEVVDEAVGRLHRAEEQARTVTLKVRLANFTTFTRSRTLAAPTDDVNVVQRIARQLLEEANVASPVRLLGVRFTGLAHEGPRQTSLAAWPADVLGEADGWKPDGPPRRWRFG